ncbi:hypothetical protein IJ21_00270 [Paenibacillus sp. 32O-W]|uniref:hypothetical protein n=1 Tax=Paenibacillus sp. 32O-W TaxID=1695218 RepID=UPI000721BAA0|nr:hypothetical protein [Paenibacillus sp. 32O-W]ALS25482.1 hypothetical protein IJ21_00270 [Paenibacillus sp. 32O-W]
MAKTDWNLNDSVMPEDMNQIGQEINDMAESLDNHINATLVHGATDAATPNRIARRDANGQFEVGAPTAANHVARKVDLDEVKQSVSDGKNQIASAITGMGQTASGSDTFAQLSGKIRDISKDANAAVGDVLTGKTFYQGGVKRTGTMANKTTDYGAPFTGQTGRLYLRPEAGYHNGTVRVYTDDGNFAPQHIKAGVPIWGVTGTFTSDANAAAADILSGKTAYVNGNKVTGSMPNRSAENFHMPALERTIWQDDKVFLRPPEGYYDGYSWIMTPAGNLNPNNIREGAEILGVWGTLRAWNGEKRTASGSGTRNTNAQLVYQDSSYYTQVGDWPMFQSPHIGWKIGAVVMTTTSATYGENFLTIAFSDIVINRYSPNSHGGWTGVMINLNNWSGSYIIFNTKSNGASIGSIDFQLPHMHSRIDYWQAWEL